ncbi:bifunctional tRNA (5-methylaminomethyl-2-thiouridine)(34)-methyltransferase MnmD/FAD-dependent 5-carboxymethylaminomethyl-2-thiouridine(34) oxidoreductase MnmC [Piscinibacter sp. HJYY11]|uniref:bifunctional tRNA (5-methylaminomethyl-2-thiouridine)(34)-methyltransferase MnmD/FAD-dependent 5-carboxymethylaminomethyl-2-thiouridine(34) oxidoreductase MnmC n=1 Tax=Piscinibacter sp. HJYY11 TaxID=2801333 RepID=UPI00191E6D44|nr:bifunctional tRNA (5-methylaminomethyl-2-thiouridine)(34)-methyltransferase MnmD/FAD-dependent 5-carboxymethylaminomethyl-2-thiouridine(34) oxidoreductase MnmC [Piscinibacter sp. HJYY11]MBL0731074.1 bifunctional tRNA (5-methylaminomethyl-2-thiouridine)(34)-methyltransferase MnmD/FAD-dependent 5-carboxymethylaminomethyl-2-thiouridine(34) oxidoreductase MnmC [Piscinibacter sp. HJYY11]
MNTRPITAATLAYTDDGVPYSAHYQDIYHPRAGAFVQARYVFLGGNELPARWQGRSRFVVLETGFGLGNNFLATWQAWRDDPARCERLVFISVEQHPLTADDMRRAHAQSPAPTLAATLVDAWPSLTHNLHTLEFEAGRVRLLLALGDVRSWLPELVADVDAFYLDGFAPARNAEMWDAHIAKALARLAAPGATLATWTSASAVREGLRSAGFDVREARGTGGKRDITLARYAPSFVPRRPPSRTSRHATPQHALIVGAGLAGSATALALAQEGWSSTVYDRRDTPASETSGNPAGLFHGIVNAQDGTHARFNRAAALMARRAIRRVLEDPSVAGAINGLLRLDEAQPAALQDVITRLGLPADYVQAVSPAEASALSGVTLRQAAWFYPGGGWVDPAATARAWLAQASPLARFQGGVTVSRLKRHGDSWQLLDAEGRVLDEAESVVLANAAEAMRLLDAHDWPIGIVRGQISHFQRDLVPHLVLPRLPLAGSGYVLPEVNGLALFGATSQPGDREPDVRPADHAANLAVLRDLTGVELGDLPIETVHGRVGWRTAAQDRLPVVGAVPAPADQQGRLDQPRFVHCLPGLFVFTALGSRGITWSTLGARTVASWIAGAPAPIEASLVDAIAPARFISRSARRPRVG